MKSPNFSLWDELHGGRDLKRRQSFCFPSWENRTIYSVDGKLSPSIKSVKHNFKNIDFILYLPYYFLILKLLLICFPE